MTCAVTDCDRAHYARGLCARHYAKRRVENAPLCAVKGCEQRARAKGFCNLHYLRMTTHGEPRSAQPTKVANGTLRRWLDEHKSHSGDECLIWPFGRYPNGYGKINGKRGGEIASRVMCELVHGAPPSPERHAAHSCGRGSDGCVNPRHLRWATVTENSADRIDHGTSNRGSRHGLAKLTDLQVLEIFTRAHAGEVQREIARDFGINQTRVSAIKRGKEWGWLTGGVA